MKRYFMSGLFLILCIMFVNARPESIELHEPTKASEYNRIDDVKKECSSILPPDSDHEPYENRVYRVPEKLSFVNGDWSQDLEKAPLIPYDDKQNGFLDQSSPLNLVSFWITDVDHIYQSKNSFNVNGVLQLGMVMGELFGSKPFERFPIFTIYSGRSELRMSFQGIVAGTEEKNGESIMCLLGNAVLPSRYPDSNNPWDWVKEPGYINQPPLIHDDGILLVIHYPKTFSLTKRGIHGILKSLNPKSSPKYFDEIHISASLSRSENYEFSSLNLLSKAYPSYPYKSNFPNNNLGVYKGADFCSILERFSREGPIAIIPNWRCNGTDEFCSKLGPFESDASIKATNGGFRGVTLSLEDVRCEEAPSEGKNGDFKKVASLIRVVPPSEPFYIEAQRTGLKMTLSAEGMWEPSGGQLCMIGCREIVDEGIGGCDSRICLYIPLSFSITQRSIILGSISSVEGSNKSYFPLRFEKRVHYGDLYNHYTKSRPYYKYTKIQLARAVLKKHESFSFKTVIKKSFLTFPNVKDQESFLVGLSRLAEDLTLNRPAVPESAFGHFCSPTDVQIEILSLGPLFGHYQSAQKDSILEEDPPYNDRQLPMNVSAQLSIIGDQYSNFSDLFVEGLYHPLVGKMYLVGCRDVRASPNLLYDSTDLENGFDCRIEVVVSYPPTTTFWLVNPTVKISITSQRNEPDPLFFRPVKLQTIQVRFQLQQEDIHSNRGVERMLQVVTPLLAICCIIILAIIVVHVQQKWSFKKLGRIFAFERLTNRRMMKLK